MKKAELLAPAGNFECLKAAISNGADAVYLGGKNFSARAFAGNFDHDELKKAIEYAHLRNVRVFVTLNTLLTEKEFSNAIKEAEFCYSSNVDALLVQDLGLYDVIKQRFPDFELHCSTQMHIHNIAGIQTAKKLGFSRVVIARESDLDFIRQACRQGIEIETFVHGAICVSYSGQCLVSSATKNRSANKGMCAQCCRLKYALKDPNGNRVRTDTDYLLSPKDMMLIDDIPKLIEAGVSSFKIEGRMKSPAYVGYVTSVYRKAIDSFYENREYVPSQDDIDNLKVLFNRNFTSDLIHGKEDLFGQKTPNHLGIEIGETINCKNGSVYIRLSRPLNQFDGIRINDFGCIVNMLYKNDLLVSHADKGDVVSIRCEDRLRGKVYKTYDYLLEKEVTEREEKRIPLCIHAVILPDKEVTVQMKYPDEEYTYQSSIIAQKAQKLPLNEENIRKQFDRLNDTVYCLKEFTAETEDAFLPVKELNQIRRDAIESLNLHRLNSFRHKGVLPSNETRPLTDEISSRDLIEKDGFLYSDENEYTVYPVVNRESLYPDTDKAVICEWGGLFCDAERKIAYYTLNCCNSHTYEFLKKNGFESVILSTELHDNEIAGLIEAYEERTEKKINPYSLAEGNRVLMYIKTDPFRKYIGKKEGYFLDDGNNTYSIRYRNGITELLENGCNTDKLRFKTVK